MTFLFPYSPNWSSGVLERLAWLTDVQTSHTGIERRIRLRHGARRSLEWSVLAHGNDATRLDALLWHSQTREMLVPVWTDGYALPGALASGALEVPAPTEWRDYTAGGQAVVWASSNAYELVEIEGVEADRLILSSGLTQPWPAGARVYPVRAARLSRVPLERITAGVVTAVVAAEFIDTDAPAPVTTTKTYSDRQVFDLRPNRIESVSAQYERLATALDFQIGLVILDDHAGRPFVTRSHRHLVAGREAIWWWRRWLAGLGGRYTGVFVPSHQADLTLTQDVEAGWSLRVRRIDWTHYGTTTRARTGRNAVQVRLRDGTTYERHILTSTLVSDTVEQLTLGNPLPAIARDEVVQICWLEPVRLASDVVEIAWRSAEVVEVVLPWHQVME